MLSGLLDYVLFSERTNESLNQLVLPLGDTEIYPLRCVCVIQPVEDAYDHRLTL